MKKQRLNKKKALISCAFTLLLSACSTSSNIDVAQQHYDNGNYMKAYELLIPLAHDGNDLAQYALGYMYFHGLGVAKSEDFARSWLEKAANQGNPYAKEGLKMIIEDTDYIPTPTNDDPKDMMHTEQTFITK